MGNREPFMELMPCTLFLVPITSLCVRSVHFPFSSLPLLLFFLCLSQPISASAAHILGDIYRERHEAVLPVVRLLLYHNRFVPFVSAVAALELDNTQ